MVTHNHSTIIMDIACRHASTRRRGGDAVAVQASLNELTGNAIFLATILGKQRAIRSILALADGVRAQEIDQSYVSTAL